MLCKPCYQNRVRREGGAFGLCWQHKKTKCRLCGNLSSGKQYCVKCEHASEIARWKEESKPTHFDEDHDLFQIELRLQKLSESKYHAHRAIEIFFRAMALSVEALWGEVKDPVEKRDPKVVEDFKVV